MRRWTEWQNAAAVLACKRSVRWPDCQQGSSTIRTKWTMVDGETDVTRPRRWAPWTEISELFDGFEDPAWATDQGQLAGDVRDPWSAHVGMQSAHTSS
jgi:hypothetical protein